MAAHCKVLDPHLLSWPLRVAAPHGWPDLGQGPGCISGRDTPVQVHTCTGTHPLMARSLWLCRRRLAPGPVKAALSCHKILHLVSGRTQLPHAMLTKGMVRQTWGSQGSGVRAPGETGIPAVQDHLCPCGVQSHKVPRIPDSSSLLLGASADEVKERPHPKPGFSGSHPPFH